MHLASGVQGIVQDAWFLVLVLLLVLLCAHTAVDGSLVPRLLCHDVIMIHDSSTDGAH